MQPHAWLAFLNIGGVEWVIILIIALLLFGRRLPEVMRGLGGGVREFRKGIEGAEDEEAPRGEGESARQAGTGSVPRVEQGASNPPADAAQPQAEPRPEGERSGGT